MLLNCQLNKINLYNFNVRHISNVKIMQILLVRYSLAFLSLSRSFLSYFCYRYDIMRLKFENSLARKIYYSSILLELLEKDKQQ